MSAHVWPRLAVPFPLDLVTWSPTELAEGGELVRVVPCLVSDALRGRFDEVLGVGGWSVRFDAMPGGAVACHVSVGDVTKGAVAAGASRGGPTATADAAFAAAADLFGLRAPLPPGTSFWLPCDPDTLELLHPPDLSGLAVGADSDDEQPAAGADDEQPAAGADPVVDPDAEPEAPASGVGDDVAIDLPAAAKPTGQQMIDRLVERLKGEGQGLAAARLLVKHGGYGKDPEAARELYARLRELLMAAPAGEGAVGRG